MSRGDYQSAFRRLELAARLAPRDRVATRLLAEASAVNGNAAAAATLWMAAGTGADELGARLWWYTYVGDATIVARFQDAMRTLEQLRAERARQLAAPHDDRSTP